MMRPKWALLTTISVLLISLLLISGSSFGQFQAGNLLVSSNNQVIEYTLDGELVQQFSIPNIEMRPGYARDLVIDDNGSVQVFNGTFSPSLSSWNPSDSTWTHRQFEKWSTINNLSYGGIAVWEDSVFLTDMYTFDGGWAQGLVEFNGATGEFTRFAEEISPIDLTIGMDGLLYALHANGRRINVYSPNDLCLIRHIFLPITRFGYLVKHTAIAVDRDSNIFLADRSGDVIKIDPSGDVLCRIDTDSSLSDINIDGYGNVAFTNTSGEVIVTDSQLNLLQRFQISDSNRGFVTFVTVSPVADSANRIFGGTNEDDYVVFNPNSNQLTINGRSCLIEPGAEFVTFYGGFGNDTVVCLDRRGESDFAVLENQTMRVNCANCTFRAFEIEEAEFVGSDPTDLALLIGSPGKDDLVARNALTQLRNRNSLLTVSNVGNVFAFSDDDFDTANYRVMEPNEWLYCNLDEERVRVDCDMSNIVIEGFAQFYSLAEAREQTRLTIVDSKESDYLYATDDFMRLFNSNYDYVFADYKTVYVWSDGLGNDRATFLHSADSKQAENDLWTQFFGTDFEKTVFGFSRIDFVKP